MLDRKIKTPIPQCSRAAHTRLVSMPSPELSAKLHTSAHAQAKKNATSNPRNKSRQNLSMMLSGTNVNEEKYKAYRSVLKPRIPKGLETSKILREVDMSGHVQEADSLEKSRLEMKVKKLQKTVKQQKNELMKVYKRTAKEDQELKAMVKHLFETKRKDSLVGELQGKLQTMQENETKLLNELKEQREAENEIMDKLNMLQSDTAREIDYFREYYKTCYSQDLALETSEYQKKQREIDEEKEELLRKIKKLEGVREAEKEYEGSVYRKINGLKDQVEKERRGNEELREEVHGLKAEIKEEERRWVKDKEDLKKKIEEFREQNKVLKEKEERREKDEGKEIELLRERVRGLEEDIMRKDRRIVQQELDYKDQLGRAEKKLDMLRDEHRKLEKCQRDYEDIKREETVRDRKRVAKEKEFNERITTMKRIQDKRKREWSGVYNELLREVWDLKSGMGVMETGNNRTLSSADSRNFDHYV